MTDQTAVRERLKSNLESINERIEAAAEKSGRGRSDITLVAVTKYVDASITSALVQCGQFVLGESRPQVLWEKAKALSGESIQWHMIGHLQRNKARRTVECCSLIHSVDTLKLLKAVDSIGEELGRPIDCLLEINVANEEAKHGFTHDELETALEDAAARSL